MSFELIKRLSEAFGPPGYEVEVRKIMREELEKYGDIEQDRLGSIIAKLKGSSGPKVMLAAHMDEVGFMVKLIDKNGFIKFSPLGGWFDQVLLGQKVRIRTKKGDIIGVIGSKPPHILEPKEAEKVVKKKEMFIDIGASSKEEAEKMGVRPGDPIVPETTTERMANPNLIMGKAFDDRIGCAAVIEIMRILSKESLDVSVYGVGTTQEEVGLRGAQTSGWVVSPDLCFVLEVGIAGDVPGVKPEEAQEKVGKGPAILLRDATLIPNIKLRDFIIDLAERLKIPYQVDVLERGGTDAGRIHMIKHGVPSIVIGVPTRYIHSHVGVLSLEDFQNAVKLVSEAIKRLNEKRIKSFTE